MQAYRQFHMIKKIEELKDLGKFSGFKQEKEFQLGHKGQNCNIVYGFNGSGKTTISNVISFFANNSFISEAEKGEIFNDLKNGENAIAKLSLQTGNATYPASSERNKDIYIFNSHFVATHVFNGTKGRLKKFTNVSAEITNKEIQVLDAKINELEKSEDKLKKYNDELNARHKDIAKSKSKSFGRSLTDKNKSIQTQNLLSVSLPIKTITELETEIENLIVDYDLSKKQPELQISLDEIDQTSFDLKIELNLDSIDSLLSRNVKQFSKEVLKKRITEVQDIFEDEPHKQSTEKWFRFGKDVLKNIGKKTEKKCPTCDTNITNKFDEILAGYDGYFDETYEKFSDDLKEKIQVVSTTISSIEKCEADSIKIRSVFNKYEKLLESHFLEQHDFLQIKKNLEDLKVILESKNDNIRQNFSKPTDLDQNIQDTNLAIANLKNHKESIIAILNAKKLNTNNIEDEIRKAYKKMIILEFNQLNKSGALSIYKANCEKIKTIGQKEIPHLKVDLAKEVKEIKAESKSISKYLSKMGVTHFDIDINEEHEDENILIKYKGSDRETNKLKNTLSDGEKTALAFAYFLSKFENEVNTDEKLKASTVIIDDPISSLDENRLYSTAYLTHKYFEDVKQLIVFSHNLLFLKYFNSLSKKPECFFLSKDSLTELPEELRNFQTPYFYMLRKVVDFLDTNNQDVTYNEAKEYLPNYIRRTLETFLSFKFSKVSTENKTKFTPGLIDFNDSIEAMDFDKEEKSDLKEKIIVINSICNAHSHGNLHHTQENFYISEDDLNKLAQISMEIIETMDKLHKITFIEINEEPVSSDDSD